MLAVIKDELLEEINDIVLWCPLFIGIGILVFFLYIPPMDLTSVMLILPVISVFVFLYAYLDGYYLRALQILLFICLGIVATTCRVYTIAAPVLEMPMERAFVEATIAQIQHHPDGMRVWLANPDIRGVDAESTPKFIRVILRVKLTGSLAVGDRIRLLATLMPPKSAIIPDGFNFAEYAYFKQLGAVGAAISIPKVIEHRANDEQTFWIQRLRYFISQRIIYRMPQPQAGVAIALLIGDTSYIEPQVINSLRISGIAHLVAISGMHMVIIVSMIFFSMRWLFSRSEYICLHYDNKKIAAICSIIGSLCYLLLAGNPISAQRAFMVSALFLWGVICDRKSIPMRILMFSAIVLLILTPEALKNPSLQMSYAACIALIASSKLSFSLMNKVALPPRKVWRYVTGIFCSSIIASTATTPFLLHHFHNFSTYGVLTNIIAVPLNDFCIMFLGIAGILLMPLSLDPIPFWLMNKAIAVMLYCAQVIASLENASVYVSGVTGFSITAIAIGGLILAVGITRLRYFGLPVIIAGVIFGYQPIHADIILPGDAKLFVVRLNEQYYFSNKRGARYAKEVIQQHLGIKKINYTRDIEPQCSNEYCMLHIKDMNVLITRGYVLADCTGVDLFINLQDEQYCSGSHNAVTKADLDKLGAHIISIDGDKVYTKVSQNSAIDRHIADLTKPRRGASKY